MKTVVIPDIHNKYTVAEMIIDREKPDRTIFLGDYFDDFDDTLEITHNTATWLKNSMKKPDRIHLVGNHDWSYHTPLARCGGFSEIKMFTIREVGINFESLWKWYWMDDWLCTHAGLGNTFFRFVTNNYKHDIVTDKEKMHPHLKRIATSDLFHAVSPVRGGRDKYSGILWSDTSEFVPIPGIKQIFGHTNQHEPLWFGKDNVCIDTWLKYYAVYEDSKLEIKKNKDWNV